MARGRKRKQGTRQPNGQPYRPPLVAHTPEIEAKRRTWAGDAWKDQKAGTALGKLLHSATISPRQHAAGEAFRRAWQRWAALACAPARHPVAADPAPLRPPPTEEQEHEMKAAMHRIADKIEAAKLAIHRTPRPALAWAVAETICLDDILPPAWDAAGCVPHVAVEALRHALDALAEVFRIPQETLAVA